MPNLEDLQAQFQELRQDLHDCFIARSDTLMELLDAIASNSNASSPAELSLNPLFCRDYSALYKAVEHFFHPSSEQLANQERLKLEKQLLEVIAKVVPPPVERRFQLLALDVTPVTRPYAQTLVDRTFVYQPNTIRGNKPVNIGHLYSILSILPQRVEPYDAPWTIPLSGRRVSSNESGNDVGNDQINAVLNHPNLPRHNQFCVLVVDSSYSQRNFLQQQIQHDNLVSVVRIRSNRVFYQSPAIPELTQHPGHPRWYGERFDLKDDTTWHSPDETMQTILTTYRGRQFTVTVNAWEQMLMRGKKDCPMHQEPFTLLQIQVTDTDGKLVFRPMWLIIIGQRRGELTPLDSYQAYRQRFDLEHFLRFGKQRLLMTAYSTPEVQHEENWVQLTLLAYVQLWAARELAVYLPRSWERYQKQRSPHAQITPSTVQRDFTRIISEIGTPATAPKRRGKSPGRASGQSQVQRPRQQVVKKGTKSAPKKPIAA
jgi:hypothetical protein